MSSNGIQGKKGEANTAPLSKMSISKWKRLDHLPTMSCLTTPWNNFHHDCQGSRTTAWFNAKTAPAIPLAGPTMWISCSLVWYKIRFQDKMEERKHWEAHILHRIMGYQGWFQQYCPKAFWWCAHLCVISHGRASVIFTDLGLNNHPFLPQVPRHAWHLTASFVKLSQEPVSVSIARPSQSTCTALPCHRKLSTN